MKNKALNSQARDIFSNLGATFRVKEIAALQEKHGIPLLKYLAGFEKVDRGVYKNPLVGAKPVKAIDTRVLESMIDERFTALETLSDAIIHGHVRAMIVAGAPGVGKTYTLDKKLVEANNKGKINNYIKINGSISPIGLYVTLYENRQKGNVIVLDDIDSVFNDEESLNLLKGALDSTDVRTLSWRKDSGYLRDMDIPNDFEYEGQIVFITNVDIDGVADKGGKNGNHMSALLSRSVFLDLGIHTNEAIMVRIRSVVKNTNMTEKLGLSKAESVRIVEWMAENVNSLRSVSLRSVIQVAGFMKTTSDWQNLARLTMLKGAGI